MNCFNEFDNGKLYIDNLEEYIKDKEWHPHSTFSGVFLKHLITGDDTEKKISCHLVKIEAGCEIGYHTHETQLELHEIVEGKGICQIDTQSIDYYPGVITKIDKKINHRVVAGENDLYLFAKFIPALL